MIIEGETGSMKEKEKENMNLAPHLREKKRKAYYVSLIIITQGIMENKTIGIRDFDCKP